MCTAASDSIYFLFTQPSTGYQLSLYVACECVSMSVCNNYSPHPSPYIELSFSSSLYQSIYSPQTSQFQVLKEGSVRTCAAVIPIETSYSRHESESEWPAVSSKRLESVKSHSTGLETESSCGLECENSPSTGLVYKWRGGMEMRAGYSLALRTCYLICLNLTKVIYDY